jgi:adenine-specific DNA-methyltransferase
VIYIDPPYNTRDKDWKYNNDYVNKDDLYRHSKWLAFMERRLNVANELLNPNGSVLIVTIDEKEYLRLGLLLEQTFPDARIQMVSISVNPAAASRAGSFGRTDEFAFFVMNGVSPSRLPLSREWVSSKGRTHTGKPRWDLLRRSGSGASRKDSPGCFYPIYVDKNSGGFVKVGEPLQPGISVPEAIDGTLAILPIRKDKSEGRWMMTPEELKRRMAEGRVRVALSKKKGTAVIYYLADGEYKKIQSGDFIVTGRDVDGSMIFEEADEGGGDVVAVPSSQWRISSHDSTQYGTRLLSSILPKRKFPFPKSLYAVEDCLRFFVYSNKNAVILDFFSGSGTTAHAVMRLNRQDGGRRQCISVTNNEVAADEHAALRKDGFRPGDGAWEKWGICDYITKPRIAAAITGKTPDGKDIEGDYKFTDEFPMAEGFEENAEFFTLTYETPIAVSHNRAFERVAPLLWMRAGSEGKRIDGLPANGWAVAHTYGLLTDLDMAGPFCAAVAAAVGIRVAFIVTDDERRFQAVARQLPKGVDPVRLYESYLTNFRFSMGR